MLHRITSILALGGIYKRPHEVHYSMKITRNYRITVKEKIIYISEFLFFLLSFCLIVVAASFFLFRPSLESANEMKVVATERAISDNVKWLILYSGVGFLIFYFLYKKIAIYRNAVLYFEEENICIRSKKKIIRVHVPDILNIEIIDPMNFRNESKEQFSVVIYRLLEKPIVFRLREYSESYDIIDNFLSYEKLTSKIKNLDHTFLSEENI